MTGILPLILALLLAPLAAEATTLKAILVIEDEYDDPGLNSIAPSTRMDYGYVSKLLDTLAKKGVVDVEKTLVQGASGTYDNVMGLVTSIDVAADDILLFYFSGHGGMSNGRTYMATAEGDMLMRDDLEAAVDAREARLKIIITDVCSSSIKGLGPKSGYTSADPWDQESAFVEIYKNLLLNHEGLFHATAASEGEYAWGGDAGGNFTQSIIYETLLKDPKPTWQEVFDEARLRTQEKFAYMINMGLMSPQSYMDLVAKGITNQTPRAYSIPVLVGTVDIDTDKIDKIQPPPTPEELTIELTNKTWKKVTFYVDLNTAFDHTWSMENCAPYTLGHNKTATLTSSEPVTIFFDNRDDRFLLFTLDGGQYAFGKDTDRTITLFMLDSYEPSEQKKGSGLIGSWYWEIWVPEAQTYGVAVFTFHTDKTIDITDITGHAMMWGRWKVKVRDHEEIVTLKLTDGTQDYKDVVTATFYDDDTVMLTPSEGEVVMLYRVPDEEPQVQPYDANQPFQYLY